MFEPYTSGTESQGLMFAVVQSPEMELGPAGRRQWGSWGLERFLRIEKVRENLILLPRVVLSPATV